MIQHINWDQFIDDTEILIERIKQRRKIQRIIAVSRDGLVPAAIIAKRMGIRRIDTICIQAYEGHDKKRTSDIISYPDMGLLGHDQKYWTLVVDAICDSGHTMSEMHRLFPDALQAAVYVRHGEGRALIDKVKGVYTWTLDNDNWLKFPWEGP